VFEMSNYILDNWLNLIQIPRRSPLPPDLPLTLRGRAQRVSQTCCLAAVMVSSLLQRAFTVTPELTGAGARQGAGASTLAIKTAKPWPVLASTLKG
jgi:hypothetical protein